jgi:nicotinamidase-related amidase
LQPLLNYSNASLKETIMAVTTLDPKTALIAQAVVAGVATSVGVESTAHQAHEHGYNVTLAVDAMTDMNADAHAHSITRIFPRLGETGTTQEILALLEKRSV